MIDKNTKAITVWIAPELFDDLEHLAAEDDRPVSAYVRRLLREHVENETNRRTREKQANPLALIDANCIDGKRMAGER
jgi:hypothetical protein